MSLAASNCLPLHSNDLHLVRCDEVAHSNQFDERVSECSEDDGCAVDVFRGYSNDLEPVPRPTRAPSLEMAATTPMQRRHVRLWMWHLTGGSMTPESEQILNNKLWLPWQCRGPPGPLDGGPCK